MRFGSRVPSGAAVVQSVCSEQSVPPGVAGMAAVRCVRCSSCLRCCCHVWRPGCAIGRQVGLVGRGRHLSLPNFSAQSDEIASCGFHSHFLALNNTLNAAMLLGC